MKSVSRIFMVILAVSLACPVFAHHAITANYDVNNTTKVQGVVTGFRFKNPHVAVYFDVKNADGSTTHWISEGSAATILRREGWTGESLVPGQSIQIIGESSNDGSPMVFMRSVSILNANGSVAREISGSVEDFSVTYDATLVNLPQQLANGRPNLSGIWSGQGSPYTPPRGPVPEFNEAGLAAQVGYEIVYDPQVFCDTPGLVRLGGMTPHGIRITQYDDRVVFEYEEYGIKREVYFDHANAGTGIKSHLGDSVARYENGALVVETNNLLSELVHGGGSRLSDQARVVQTFKRVDEPGYSSLLSIQTVVSDPLYLNEDFEIVNIKMAYKDYPFIDVDCGAPLRERQQVNPAMNLFVISVGLGEALSSGGLSGADTHCAALAAGVGQGDKNWHAYSSALGENGNAGARIGTGPWYNAKGDVVAVNADELRGGASGLARASVVTERGQKLDDSNRRDILTGSLPDGLFYCFAVGSR